MPIVGGATWRGRAGPVVGYVRAGPVTATYLLVLLASHVWLHQVSGARRHRVLETVSTNDVNLRDHPIRALAGSLLFFDGTLTRVDTQLFVGTVITLGFGVAGALWWWEKHAGALRAYAIFLTGHVVATLFTWLVIRHAVATGRYPESVRTTLDYGISYGAEAMLAACTVVITGARRWLWLAAVLSWPLAAATWFGTLPDFTTVGHLTAAGVGLLLGVVLRPRPDRRSPMA
ncbi:MAG TPA: rhomboid-like protein [Jatrophihabitantaceae bacterium]|nr:rhomboid-like protein [Jatrophihabitantaceae bacterium]